MPVGQIQSWPNGERQPAALTGSRQAALPLPGWRQPLCCLPGFLILHTAAEIVTYLPLQVIEPPCLLPLSLPPCPPGAVKTFYLYHVLATGETDSTTMSLGPFNYARMPFPLRPVNPGIVVASVRDQGKQVGLWW